MLDKTKTRQERIKALLKAFTKAHDSLVLDKKRTLQIEINQDVGNYFSIGETKDTFRISVSELLLWASDEVLDCLALMLIARCYRVAYRPELWTKVKEFLADKEVVQKGQKAYMDKRSRVIPTSTGKHHDLADSFKRVREKYFSDAECAPMDLEGPDRPAVVWSTQKTYKRFGYWMGDYNLIVISRVLDSQKVPNFVLDYVVYHELLHKKHGAINLAGARECHHWDFNLEERKFDKHKEAEAFLSKVYKTKGQCLL